MEIKLNSTEQEILFEAINTWLDYYAGAISDKEKKAANKMLKKFGQDAERKK